MNSGYTKSWRKEIDSDIWQMPPLYHRVFYYLRQKAKWQTELVPTREGLGIWLLPGQIMTSLDTIAKGVSWHEYGVEKVPSRRLISHVLEHLSILECIVCVSHTKGTVISITNWDTYQQDAEEVGTDRKHRRHTIKEVKEVKELKPISDDTEKTGVSDAPPKEKKPKKKPDTNHHLFIRWWCRAFEIRFVDKYAFIAGKDGKAVSFILQHFSLQDAILKACSFILDKDPFWNDKKDLSYFRSRINNIRIPSDETMRGLVSECIIPASWDNLHEWLTEQEAVNA